MGPFVFLGEQNLFLFPKQNILSGIWNVLLISWVQIYIQLLEVICFANNYEYDCAQFSHINW